MSKVLNWHWVARDLAALGSAISVLITNNILSGTAEHYTVSILAAVNAAVLLLVSPTLNENDLIQLVKKNNPDNAKNDTAPIVPPITK